MKRLLYILILGLPFGTFAQNRIDGVHPLSGVSPELPNDELIPLMQPLFKTSKIIGIGENIHGSREILQMEHRLVKYAVENEGVRHLFMEMGLVAAENLNQYVQTCEGDVTQLVHVASWEATEDEINLMQWLCTFNLSHPYDKVAIHGVDIYNSASLDHGWFLEKIKGTSYEENAKSILTKSVGQCFGFDKTSYAEYRKEYYEYYDKKKILDPIGMTVCLNNLHDLQLVLEQRQTGNKKLSIFEVAKLQAYVRDLRALQQHLLSRAIFNEDLARLYQYRDGTMATNVIELWQALGRPKSLFMAHTSHTAKKPAPFYKNWKNADIPTAGSFISASIGDQYKVIGFTGYDTDGVQGDFIPPVSQDSLDNVLHTLRYQYAWLDVTHHEKFNRDWWVQNENADTETERPNGVWLNPAAHYDAMIYIDRAEVSKICD